MAERRIHCFTPRNSFLEFSLWDLFQGSYTVQQVHGVQVSLYPALDGNGNGQLPGVEDRQHGDRIIADQLG
jgi:hypothetical protein